MTMTKRLVFWLAAGAVLSAGAARADTGQDPAAEEHAAAVPVVSAAELAEAASPFHGGGNWQSWLEHRGDADGWEGDADLRSWWGGRKRASARAAAQSAIAAGRKVYGWLPYWATSSQISQFQWDKLTHVAYFSYEVNPTNGGCLGKHSWGSAIVQTAHNHGVKIHLTATLFGASGNKLLLQNTASCNTLAQNLVNEVKNAGGDGVCIDFESVGSWTGATKALTAFMTTLANKASAQGLEVAIALPSIDWYADFDVGSFEKLGIISIIMGYDYHYSGGTPGPVAPLKPSSLWGSQLNDDYSTRYYLGKMSNPANLLLAVPYYGRKWKTSSTSLGASNLGSGYSSSPTLSTCASSASTYGRKWDSNGSVPYFAYTDSAGAAWQCFYDDVESLGLKYDYINSKNLGGVGIWALSHEPGTAKFWNLLADKFGGSGGGSTPVEDGSAAVSWNFSASEGWTKRAENFTGTTNVAGEVWELNEAQAYPAATYGGATGDLWLDVPGSYAVTPAIKGVVATQAVLTVRAAANSNLDGRKVGIYWSANGGSSWTKAGTAGATAYDSLVPTAVAIPDAGGGASGVQFKLLDESTDQDRGTVLVYQLLVKGRDATTGTLKVVLTPSSAKWSLNGTSYASGETLTLPAGTYTVSFNALAGYDAPAAQTVTLVAGGSQTVTAKYTESTAWTRTVEFASSDGWTAKTDALFTGTTNVAGEAWSAKGLKVNPTVNSQNNIGYATLDATGDWLVTPVLQGTVTQVVGIIRAGANSNLDGRKLAVECSTDGGGTFTNVATWSATSWSNSQTRTKSCSLSAANGVKLRFYDCGINDTGKTTVVLHQLVLKGTKEVAAPKVGYLKATLTPSTAKWRVDGVARASGEIAALAPGSHTVSFDAVNGWIAPADTNATVTADKTNSFSAAYTVQPGALTVTILPEEAAASATWKVSGAGATHASGETVSLTPNTYEVTFNALTGWTAPAKQTVEVKAGEPSAVEGTYAWNPATLTVNLSPAAVQTEGKWTVDGAEHAHGDSVQLGAGTHSVSFGAVEGWDPPPATNVTLSAGGSKTLTGNYTVHGAWTKGYDFTAAEGWKERASLVPSLETNVAGEAWSMAGVKIFPTYATNNETGYIVIEQTGNWVELPAFAGCVTSVAAKVRAGAASDLDARKLTLQYDVGAGWVDWSTWSCSSYSNVQSRSKTGTVSGGTAGVKLRVLDTSTGDISKSTVVLHAITVKGSTDAGAASTGTITATLTPATATWTVGGRTYASGETAEVLAGTHAVSFNAPAGYDAPAASNVTVAAGGSKTLKSSCAARPGTLTVTLDPADVRAGARWKAGGTTNESGAAVSLAAGTYTVSFTAVDGFTTPAGLGVEVPPGGAVATNAVYAVKPASLKVTLKPAGGTWKVAGTNYASGATAKLAPGTWTVEFNPQTGYATPTASNVTVAAGQSKSMTVTYPGLAGSVRCVISPAEAAAAGATWKIDGIGHASGETAEVPSGTYTVTFGAVAGYAAPAAQTVVVDAEETVELTAAYTLQPGYLAVTLDPAGVRDAGRWFAAGTGHASGETAALAPGNYDLAFGEVENYVAPAATNVTVEAGKTNAITATYTGKPGCVTCTLTPDSGSWIVNGETYASGAAVEVPAGACTVKFGALKGYTKPADRTVEVEPGRTNSFSAAYTVKQVPLTVKLTPTNATWNVNGDGGAHASGASVKVDPGAVTVSFNPVEGFVTPEPQEVAVNVGATSKTASFAYEGLPGEVTYTLIPPEGTWIINGTTNGSGEVASVPAGEYKVTFGTLSGYTKPETQSNVTVTANGLYQGTAAYTVKQVPLTVKLSPTNNESLQAEARWSIEGMDGTHASGESVKVDPGTYTVTASDVDGWTTPAPTNVTINVGANSKSVTMKYTEAPIVPTTGTVTFTLVPAEGTSWTIGGNTYASGQTATLEAGSYDVTFGALDGYKTPAAQSVVVVAGENVARTATYTEQTTPVASPVLGEATGVTTGAFSIAWSGVTGATGYVVQVAESEEFDEAVLFSEDFTGALPDGWDASAILTNATTYAPGGKGAVVFKGAGKYLRTERVANPGRLVWHHATGSTNEWRYEVQCSTSATFQPMTCVTNITTMSTLKTPVALTADLSEYKDVYVRWLDTRPSGTAQRYISGITLTAALAAEESTAGTDADFAGLSAGTFYYVRAKAVTATGESDWSAVRTVRTSDPPLPPAAPVLEEVTGVTSNAFSIAWGAVEGAGIYQLQVADTAGFDEEPILSCDFTGDLPAGWETTGVVTNRSAYAANGGGAVVFKGANKFLRTGLVANPGTLTWYHATTSADEWSYRLEASPTTDFAGAAVIRTFVVTQKLGTAVVQTENMRYYRNVYLRWVDTRPSGAAQRFISGISLTGALVADESITATTRNVAGLSAGMTYYVRVKAWNDAGGSGWSEVKPVTTEAAPVAPTTGTVTYTLSPAEGTSWTIAGTTYASGETATVEAGTHEVTFGALDGYDTPEAQQVFVAAGQTVAGSATYTALPVETDGILTFTLVPPEGTTWIVAGTTNASGGEVTLPAGSYTVSFGAPGDYYKPANQTVAVEGGKTTSGTQVFEEKPGSIKITLKPDRLEGAGWCVLGSNYASGATAKVPAGSHDVTFLPVEGYVTPGATKLTVAANKTVSRTITYEEEPEIPTTGTVTFTLEPSEGTAWFLSGSRYTSGQSATVEAGTYPVTFSDLDGYETPASTNVTVAAGGSVAGSARYTEIAEETLAAPVLQEATGVTTGAFSIAWGAVAGATGYSVQVAETNTFDDGLVLQESFADGALPEGWTTNKATFATDRTRFSGDGTGVAVFKGKNHWLATANLARPGVAEWSHALYTGTTASNPWPYVVECSTDPDFAEVVWSTNITVAAYTTNPVPVRVDLTGLRDVYLRWRDAREGTSTAQRFLSAVTVRDGLVAGTDTAETSASFDGLDAGTTYFVRASATNAETASDWSLVKTVRTADPPQPPAAPVLEEATGVTGNAFTIAWYAVEGAGIYHLQVSDSAAFDGEPILSCDFTGELPSGWETTGNLLNSSTYGADGKGAIQFKAAGKYLRTPLVANPATLTWHHATTSTDEWSYRLEASPTTDFSMPMIVQTVTVTQKLATAVQMTANLRTCRNVYLRWVDTRPSGQAQRFISGVSLTGALLVDEPGLTATSRTVTSLSAGTTYYVRVKARSEGGWSGWSTVKSVTTADGGEGEWDPDNPPENPYLEERTDWTIEGEFRDGKLVLDWEALDGAIGYNIEATTNLLDENSWRRVETRYDADGAELGTDGGEGVFYRIRAW
jgi:spore germination protein YaaH